MVHDEANLVIERLNNLEVTRATLLQSAVGGILSKKSREAFNDQIRDINIETVARVLEPPEG